MARRTKAAAASAEAPPAPLALPAELTIYTVGELRPQWLSWLGALPAGGGAVAPVQAAALDQVDAAGLQMLLSLGHALERLGLRLQLQGANDVLQGACETLGLAGWLQGCTGAAPAPAEARS